MFAKLADSGVDQIKVLASGLVDLEKFGRVGKPQFTRDELKDTVCLAKDVGLGVMAHANGPDAVAWALNAGVRSVENTVTSWVRKTCPAWRIWAQYGFLRFSLWPPWWNGKPI